MSVMMSGSSKSTSSGFFSAISSLTQPRQPPSTVTPPTSVDPSSSPIRSSSPMLRDSFDPTVTDLRNSPPALACDKGTKSVVTTKPKRRGDCDEDLEIPSKRFKTLQTTWNCTDQPSETSIYFNERMLELSRITRRAFSARIRYQRLRDHELDLIKSLLNDEKELVQTHMKKIDLQIGSLRNTLEDAGVTEIGNKGFLREPAIKQISYPLTTSQIPLLHTRGFLAVSFPSLRSILFAHFFSRAFDLIFRQLWTIISLSAPLLTNSSLIFSSTLRISLSALPGKSRNRPQLGYSTGMGHTAGMGVTGMAGTGTVSRCGTRGHTVPVSTVYGTESGKDETAEQQAQGEMRRRAHPKRARRATCRRRLAPCNDDEADLTTSTAVERVFSQGRHLLHFTRNRLSPSSTRAFLCLGSWLRCDLVAPEDLTKIMTSLKKRKREDESVELHSPRSTSSNISDSGFCIRILQSASMLNLKWLRLQIFPDPIVTTRRRKWGYGGSASHGEVSGGLGTYPIIRENSGLCQALAIKFQLMKLLAIFAIAYEHHQILFRYSLVAQEHYTEVQTASMSRAAKSRSTSTIYNDFIKDDELRSSGWLIHRSASASTLAANTSIRPPTTPSAVSDFRVIEEVDPAFSITDRAIE
ncbi:hypothetical protein EV424DRAFT_1348474 [Suillus variegatus]|nr:hypothetical protein EV424DRAFT_1348474 [Suillus variegatus]